MECLQDLLELIKTVTLWDVLVQGIGICAAVLGISSFQGKTQKQIVLLQLLGNILWSLHFLLLGAWAGGILNAIAIFRGLVFYFRTDKKWARSPVWYVVFCALFVGAAVFSWIFEDGAWSLLPLAGMILTTFSLALHDPFRVRAVTFFASPCWLVYNAINGSIPGVLTESFAICSIIIGILRMDLPLLLKKRKEKRNFD